jgi:hypothetical protein
MGCDIIMADASARRLRDGGGCGEVISWHEGCRTASG